MLFQNHVNARLVVEKSELVAKVQALVNDERAEREAHARREDAEERELQEAIEASRREHAEREEVLRRERESLQEQATEQAAGSASDEIPQQGSATSSSPSPPPSSNSKEETPRGKVSPGKAQSMASYLERTGLCVICQDEEANIAIVDCGYVILIICVQFYGAE